MGFETLKRFLSLNKFTDITRQCFNLGDKEYDLTHAKDSVNDTNMMFNTDDSPKKVLKKIDERRKDFNED